MATVCDEVSFKSLLKEVEMELKLKIVQVKGEGAVGDWTLTFHSAFDPQQATKEEKKRARANSIHGNGTYVIIKAGMSQQGNPGEEFLHAKIFSPNDDSGPYVQDLLLDKTLKDRVEDF